jgi:hypothetical protein
MAARGFNYPNTVAAAAAHWPRVPTRTEIVTALADVTCKQQVNLPGIWLAAQAGYENELIEEHRAALDTVRRFLSTGIMRARRVSGTAAA